MPNTLMSTPPRLGCGWAIDWRQVGRPRLGSAGWRDRPPLTSPYYTTAHIASLQRSSISYHCNQVPSSHH